MTRAPGVPAGADGQTLFFDRRMSADGTVACVDCHDPGRGFSDTRSLSLGVYRRVHEARAELRRALRGNEGSDT